MQIPTIAKARLSSSRAAEGIALPSEHPKEGTDLPSEHTKEGTGLPSEHPCEGSQLPFVHWLLSLHMDKAQQGQLLQAWLSAGGGLSLSAWQSFLDQCNHTQVMCSRPVACACSVDMSMIP